MKILLDSSLAENGLTSPYQHLNLKIEPGPPVIVPEEVIRKAQSQHDVLVDWMKGVGVDLCHEMEDVQNQHILEGCCGQAEGV